MATCYFVCEENAPGALKYRIRGSRGKEEFWAAVRECPEPLLSALSAEASGWTIEEYYTEDDDHGDAFRYFSSDTILHPVTVENAIVKDGVFAGAFYRNKIDGSLTPVLTGNDNYVTDTDRLSETHDLDKQSHGQLLRKGEK